MLEGKGKAHLNKVRYFVQIAREVSKISGAVPEQPLWLLYIFNKNRKEWCRDGIFQRSWRDVLGMSGYSGAAVSGYSD